MDVVWLLVSGRLLLSDWLAGWFVGWLLWFPSCVCGLACIIVGGGVVICFCHAMPCLRALSEIPSRFLNEK